MKQLPKHFAIKKDADNPLWDKYISWLNDYARKNGYFGPSWNGGINAYYGVTDNYDCGNTRWHYQLKTFPEGTVELTLEEWDEIVNGFKLPEKWYCVVTPENKQMLNEWRRNSVTYPAKITVDENQLILSDHPDGSYYFGGEEREFLEKPHFSGYKKITTEQFIKHFIKPVLKQKEMKEEILKPDQEVHLGDMPYRVRKSGIYWYMNADRGVNYAIFDKLGLDGAEFQKKVLGYTFSGSFPECKSLEDLTKFVNAIKGEISKQKEKKRKISAVDAQRIIDIACVGNWKPKLAEKWGKDIVMGNPIFVSEDFYQEMRKACTKWQHELFDEIFGKDEEVYPDGTPCLVRTSDKDTWNLRYANGKGEFYNKGRKSGESYTWQHHMKLDINNLPVNE